MKPENGILLDEPTGRIELFSDFDKSLTFEYDELLNRLELKQESIQLFGKTVLQPRLSRFYSDPGISYVYSNQEFSGKEWTNELSVLNRAIQERTSEGFNSALVNFYRDGTDSMGLHADNEQELGKNPTIASMNYGASRKMVFRRNGTKEKFEIILNHGDLLIMSGALQHNWKHELPKQRRVNASRLNITFRKILT
ncbi:MAG: alpha-ketoglutarate-dependent dioxygenase AlkB [Crocinitomicaceae bacterium]